MKIAISGKGGVGKTTIMALLADQFNKNGQQVLVIDADPSPHLAQTMGMASTDDITPIAEMRELLVERSGKVEGSPFYQINPKINDLPDRFMVEKNGIKLMVLGAIQTAEGGCACPENTVLKRLLTKLMLYSNQIILLDMEAGVEHLGRGTIAGADHLLITVIPSKSSVRTAHKVQKMAIESGIPQISFVGNMIKDQDDIDFLTNQLGESPTACFPDANEIRKAERSGMAISGTSSAADESAATLCNILLKEN